MIRVSTAHSTSVVFLDWNESTFGCRQGKLIVVKYYHVVLNGICTRERLPLYDYH